MNTEHYRYFAHVYEVKDFSAASRRIPMSLPGLTKAIKRLEEQLGVPLFSRTDGGALVPTPYGDEFYSFVKQYFSSVDLLDNTFRSITASMENEIHIGFSTGILEMMGVHFLEGYEQSHPEVRIVTHEFKDYLCDLSLKNRECDLIFTLKPYDDQFMVKDVYHGTVEMWVNKSNHLSNKERIEISDLEGQSIAMPGRGFKCYENLLSLCEAESVRLGKIHETGEIFRTYEYALKNLALGYTNGHLVNLGVFQNPEILVNIPVDGWFWHFGIAYLPDRVLTPSELDFCKYTHEYARRNNLTNCGVF